MIVAGMAIGGVAGWAVGWAGERLGWPPVRFATVGLPAVAAISAGLILLLGEVAQ